MTPTDHDEASEREASPQDAASPPPSAPVSPQDAAPVRRRPPRARPFFLLALLFCLLALLIALNTPRFRQPLAELWRSLRGRPTVASRVRQYATAAHGRLLPRFEKCGVEYPPRQVVLAYFKESEQMELYAAGKDGVLHFLHSYPVLGSSGKVGPKLREGDLQVPEGIYRIDYLNPNSSYHLSMALNYPNAFDRKQAAREGRKHLGGDIMIHGKAVSIGCLAMGDEAAEELFLLAAETGIPRIQVLLSPVDFRKSRAPTDASLPKWTSELYAQLAREIRKLPKTANTTDTLPSGGQATRPSDPA